MSAGDDHILSSIQAKWMIMIITMRMRIIMMIMIIRMMMMMLIRIIHFLRSIQGDGSDHNQAKMMIMMRRVNTVH